MTASTPASSASNQGPIETAFSSVESLAFVEALYESYLRDPASVDSDWRAAFEALSDKDPFARRARLGPSFAQSTVFNPPGNGHAAATASRNGNGQVSTVGGMHEDAIAIAELQDRVDQLVRAFRVRGHLVAQIDPLGRPRPEQVELDPEFHGITAVDMDRTVSSQSVGGPNMMTVREIVTRLRNTYCRSIGVQFMHIDELAVKHWLQARIEYTENRLTLEREQQRRILTRLTDAVMFEEFIQRKFTGAKSFSLEGAESLIPLLDLAVEHAGEQGVDEIVFAMAHRGRLNVLANIMGKGARKIFREFEDTASDSRAGRGDVKYHLGYSSNWKTQSGRNIHLSLCFNPSHLEYVNPVALGRVRAKQDRAGDAARERKIAILIHGDAAFIGEGITQETLNLSDLKGYTVGGTLHVVVNNQIGFTTPPEESRSCTYATDVAKMIEAPIFHVNGEDPEAVVQTVRLAMDFRREFRRDVVIDMYCFRRRGHNEGDEPSFTQPLMYNLIEKRKPVREHYLDHLLKLDGITAKEAEEIEVDRREHLESELAIARREQGSGRQAPLTMVWAAYHGGAYADTKEVETKIDATRLGQLFDTLTTVPDAFNLNRKLGRFVDARKEMARGEKPIDWATAETLAFASLLGDGVPIRMSGQDVERGTFSQRHNVWHDMETDARYRPLDYVSPKQAQLELYNSPLSEAGVLGFEYGYSLDTPDGLTIWEAQFGDFINCAQVIIDQFVASAEDKWRYLTGIVLLLPHGFEGMGPEHSSARMERFLLLAADDNMQVACPSTPAQYFHLLRRQVMRKWRKPMIVFTPKSLLRNPECTSSLADLTARRFHRILPDTTNTRPDPTRILICSGKIYYELIKEREARGLNDKIAILRLEQLYPLPDAIVERAFKDYKPGTPVVWIQEEPENMGAWRFLQNQFEGTVLDKFPLSGIQRPPAASPAAGSATQHKKEQQAIFDKAFS